MLRSLNVNRKQSFHLKTKFAVVLNGRLGNIIHQLDNVGF